MAKSNQGVKRSRPAVQVVSCPSDFPTPFSGKRSERYDQRQSNQTKRKKDSKLLDWHDTSKEIRSLGATAFVKQQKRTYEQEIYKTLTGREKKQHKVPVKIVRGIKKKAAQRQDHVEKEAKAAGIVLPTQRKQQGKQRTSAANGSRESRIHGPAPSAGFMKKGVLKISKPT